jgi:hypothetical protein
VSIYCNCCVFYFGAACCKGHVNVLLPLELVAYPFVGFANRAKQHHSWNMNIIKLNNGLVKVK